MSLLLKALQQADRGSELSLEPLEPKKSGGEPPSMPPSSAKAAATLMLDKQARAEKYRLLILLGVLVAVVVGMGVYFYLAVFMPWVFLPKPAPIVPPAVQAAVAPASVEPANIEPAKIEPANNESARVAAEPEALPSLASPAPQVKAAAPVQQVVPFSKPVAPGREAPESPVQISGGNKAAPSQNMQVAYQLLEAGRLEEARRAYEALRAQEPNNSDVLLGLGLIAQRQGRSDDAAKLYLKTLDLDPKNAFAQASLSAMIARADPAAAEKKLQALITQQPGAAFLHFRLGNVLAAQGRWHEAQKVYFEAQRLESDAPDYAFNLAISLERIQQPRAALEYYQRALRLAQNKAATFDTAQAKARIQALSTPN